MGKVGPFGRLVRGRHGMRADDILVTSWFGKRGRESSFGSVVNNPERKTRLQREIEATDRQIDQLVYELYALTAWIGDLA